MIAVHSLGTIVLEVTNLQRPAVSIELGRNNFRVQLDPVAKTEVINIALQIGLHLRAAGHTRIASRHRQLRKAIDAFTVLSSQPGVSTRRTPHSADVQSPVEYVDIVASITQHFRIGQASDTRPNYRNPHLVQPVKPDRLFPENSDGANCQVAGAMRWLLECLDSGRQECCPFGEVAIVGDASVGLVEKACGEACPEDPVDSQRRQDCAVVLGQCRHPVGDPVGQFGV